MAKDKSVVRSSVAWNGEHSCYNYCSDSPHFIFLATQEMNYAFANKKLYEASLCARKRESHANACGGEVYRKLIVHWLMRYRAVL